MAMLYHRPISVRAGADGRPVSFVWPAGGSAAPARSGERRIVAIHRSWRVRWNWWSQETHRLYFRVETAESGVYDLYHEQAAGQEQAWYLERVWD